MFGRRRILVLPRDIAQSVKRAVAHVAHAMADLRFRLGGTYEEAKPIIMLGLDGSGRTTILHALKPGEVITTWSSIAYYFQAIKFKHRHLGLTSISAYSLSIRDKCWPLLHWYLMRAGGMIYVVDSNDHDRIAEAGEDVQFLLKQETLQGMPLMVIANKQDLLNAMSVEEAKRHLNLGTVTGREVACMPAVAIEGKGLWAAVDWTVEAVGRHHQSRQYLGKYLPKEDSEEMGRLLIQSVPQGSGWTQ